MLRELAEDRRLGQATVALTAPDPHFVRVRLTSVRRALRNLIHNAIRYGNSAEILLEYKKTELQIVIDDRGPGVPEEKMASIFEPFVRLEGLRSRNTGGIGLGLAIARTIVQAHGGEIVLSNGTEGGLRVSVHLPNRSDLKTEFVSEESVK